MGCGGGGALAPGQGKGSSSTVVFYTDLIEKDAPGSIVYTTVEEDASLPGTEPVIEHIHLSGHP